MVVCPPRWAPLEWSWAAPDPPLTQPSLPLDITLGRKRGIWKGSGGWGGWRAERRGPERKERSLRVTAHRSLATQMTWERDKQRVWEKQLVRLWLLNPHFHGHQSTSTTQFFPALVLLCLTHSDPVTLVLFQFYRCGNGNLGQLNHVSQITADRWRAQLCRRGKPALLSPLLTSTQT